MDSADVECAATTGTARLGPQHWGALVGIVLGLAYVCLVQPGTPADEPAHFSNIVYYAKHLSMPVLGQPEVRHEGQMGPVYYVLSAGIYALAHRGGDRLAFYTIRALGLLLLWPLSVLAYRIAARLRGRADLAVTLVAVFTVANPSILSIASSLQNDILAIVLCMWAIDLCGRWLCDAPPNSRYGFLLALVVSAGVLTKATVTFMLIGVPMVAVILHRRRAIGFVASFVACSIVLCGWWYLRNIVLYGDATAQAALTRFNYGNNPAPTQLWIPRELGRWIWGIMAYHWGATEYYRHLFSAPFWYRALSGLLTATAIAGWIMFLTRRSRSERGVVINHRFAVVLAMLSGVCGAIFIYSCVRVTSFAARCMFPVFVVFAIFLCFGIVFTLGGLRRRENVIGAAVVFASLAAMNLFSLVTAAKMPRMPFNPF